jgi:hypothetical protein
VDILGQSYIRRPVEKQRDFKPNPVFRRIGKIRRDRLELDDVVGFRRDLRQAFVLAFLLLLGGALACLGLLFLLRALMFGASMPPTTQPPPPPSSVRTAGR